MKIAAYIRNIFELCEQEKFLLLPKKGYPSINNWSIFLLDIFICSPHYLYILCQLHILRNVIISIFN